MRLLRVFGGILRRRAAIVKITPLPMPHHRGRDVVPVSQDREGAGSPRREILYSADDANLVLPLPEHRHTFAAIRFRPSK
jgi:hypothetical protein